MATIGVDCQIILDGIGYHIEPGSWTVLRRRNATVIPVSGPKHGPYPPPGGPTPEGAPAPDIMTGPTPHKILDRGPWLRTWAMRVLCFNNIATYEPATTTVTGQYLRDQLVHTFDKVDTIVSFTDPSGQVYGVTASIYAEQIRDLRSQRPGIEYVCPILLTESV